LANVKTGAMKRKRYHL